MPDPREVDYLSDRGYEFDPLATTCCLLVYAPSKFGLVILEK